MSEIDVLEEITMPASSSPGMPSPAPSPSTPEGGSESVSMTISKERFDQLNSAVQDLAALLADMTGTVEAEKAAMEPVMNAAPAMDSDVADLEMFAKELNARSV